MALAAAVPMAAAPTATRTVAAIRVVPVPAMVPAATRGGYGSGGYSSGGSRGSYDPYESRPVRRSEPSTADINGSASYGLAAATSKVTNRSRVHQSKEIPTLAVGDTVRHTKFGEGRVLAVEGSGDKTVAKVRFGSEEKRLLLRYAPLEKVS